MMGRRRKAAGILALLLVLGNAGATTLQRMSLEELVAASAVVVRARCVGSESRWENGRIWTFTTVEVVETLKGSVPSPLRVRLIGGRVGSLVSHVEGVPRFVEDEEAYLLLVPTGTGDWTVTAWVLGTFRVQREKPGGRETVAQDAGGVSLFDPATRQFQPGGVRHMPVEEFRRQVYAAAARDARRSR